MEKNEYGRNNNEITNSICNLWKSGRRFGESNESPSAGCKSLSQTRGRSAGGAFIYGDSTPTPVLDEKTQKDIREMRRRKLNLNIKYLDLIPELPKVII